MSPTQKNSASDAREQTLETPITAAESVYTYYDAGQFEKAEALCWELYRADPNHPGALHVGGLLENRTGNCVRAVALIDLANAIAPSARAYVDAAAIHEQHGNFKEAADRFQAACSLDPANPDIRYNLAKVLYLAGNIDAAILACGNALQVTPDSAEAFNLLGAAFSRKNQWKEAADNFRAAVALTPDNADANNNLALTLSLDGKLEDAVVSFRRAITLRPDFYAAHSNLLLYLSHIENVSPQTLYEAHLEFGNTFAACRKDWPTHENTREPNRRLRLGFVSGDLREHAVAYHVETIWTELHPELVEIWAYSSCAAEDGTTQRLKQLSHHWHQVFHLSDDELYACILHDKIDILIDLSGHTEHNRLPVFARKPAPVQASWIGYPATTGMQAMDYYLADRNLAPPGTIDAFFTEKIARLPAVCRFRPYAHAPDINRLPALGKEIEGIFTFGSFNRYVKLSDTVIALWSRVLNHVPHSRMLLGAISDEGKKNLLIERFGEYGIAAERLVFYPLTTMREYLALHHKVDLILDTFPYSGGTTSCHAIWMGVPVLTLVGETMSSRQSAAILSLTGLTDFITESEDAFIASAKDWTIRLEELDHIRTTRRDKINASPLMDSVLIARGFEQAMRHMWCRWCENLAPERFEIVP